MPSQPAPPVLHELAGWSPYQQHTSAALVIESPIAAMLLGAGGAACASVVPPTSASWSARRRVVHSVGRRMTGLPDAKMGGRADGRRYAGTLPDPSKTALEPIGPDARARRGRNSTNTPA